MSIIQVQPYKALLEQSYFAYKLQLTKGEAAKPQDKAQAPPRTSTTF